MIKTDAKFEYSLILPCYNESGALAYLFNQYGPLALERSVEVVFVNNGSKDDTEAVYQQLLEKNPQYKNVFKYVHEIVNKGVGGGLKAGARAASGQWLAFTHADEQYGRASVEKIIQLKEQHKEKDLVLFKGCRSGRPVRALFFSRCFDVAASLATGMAFFDINAQPKIFKAPPREFWNYAPDDYCIDVFMIASYKKAGGLVRSTLVPLQERLSGTSSWSRGYKGTMKLASNYVQFLRAVDLHPGAQVLAQGSKKI